jgi:hypothetical protein
MRAAFIDTRRASGAISIPEDLPLSLSFICWSQDHYADATILDYGVLLQRGGPEYYIGCTGHSVPAANLERIIQIEFQPRSPQGPRPEYGDGYAYFSYTGADNLPHKMQVFVQATKLSDKFHYYPNVICVINSWELTNEKELRKYNTKYAGIKQTEPVSTGGYTESNFEVTATLPAGSYTPAQLGTTVSQLLSALGVGPGGATSTRPTKSAFLHYSSDFTRFLSAEINSLGKSNDFQYRVPHWIGATEVALEYVDAIQRFQWSFLHLPLQSTKSPEVKYVTAAGNGEQWLSTAHSGVSFTALSPASFWADQLGFDLSTLCCTVEHVLSTTGNIVNAYVPRVRLTEGVNVVGAFAGIAVAVVPGGTYDIVSFPNAPVETDITVPCIADAPAETISQSHFLLEVNNLSPSNMVGMGKSSATLRAIINQFESYGSFSSAGEESSIAVISISQPYLISSLRVRILSPDGTPANVGTNNSIYLVVNAAEDPESGQAATVKPTTGDEIHPKTRADKKRRRKRKNN